MPTSIYCTYLTVYTGNKLPPFYIGSTSIDNINKGYRGSVQSKQYKSIWKQELKAHPELFKTIILTRHSTKQDSMIREEHIQKHLNVINNPLYINLCISGKLFTDNTGKVRSTETREKIKSNHKGMLGLKHSEETKSKMSSSAMGNTNSKGSNRSKPKLEQEYIDPLEKKNIRNALISKSRIDRVYWILHTPQGNVIEINNPRGFCMDNNLHFRALQYSYQNNTPIKLGNLSYGWSIIGKYFVNKNDREK